MMLPHPHTFTLAQQTHKINYIASALQRTSSKRARKLIRVNMKDKYLINMIVCGYDDDEPHKFHMKFIHLLVFPLLPLINNVYHRKLFKISSEL